MTIRTVLNELFPFSGTISHFIAEDRMSSNLSPMQVALRLLGDGHEICGTTSGRISNDLESTMMERASVEVIYRGHGRILPSDAFTYYVEDVVNSEEYQGWVGGYEYAIENYGTLVPLRANLNLSDIEWLIHNQPDDVGAYILEAIKPSEKYVYTEVNFDPEDCEIIGVRILKDTPFAWELTRILRDYIIGYEEFE